MSQHQPTPGIVRLIIGAVLTVITGVPIGWIVARIVAVELKPVTEQFDGDGYVVVFGGMFGVILAMPFLIGIILLVDGILVVRRHRRRLLDADHG